MFSRFDTIPACDRRTDRRTDGRRDGRTDVQPIAITYFSIADARKNSNFRSKTAIIFVEQILGCKFSLTHSLRQLPNGLWWHQLRQLLLLRHVLITSLLWGAPTVDTDTGISYSNTNYSAQITHPLKPGFHYPSWRPELTGNGNRSRHPSTRAVNTGSGNRA